jgi:hypothetical protein
MLDCGAGRHAEDDESLEGRPRATIGTVLGVRETERAFRRGEARSWARKPYWIKISTARRPTKRDVPRGEEALMREALPRLSDMVGGYRCDASLRWVEVDKKRKRRGKADVQPCFWANVGRRNAQ